MLFLPLESLKNPSQAGSVSSPPDPYVNSCNRPKQNKLLWSHLKPGKTHRAGAHALGGQWPNTGGRPEPSCLTPALLSFCSLHWAPDPQVPIPHPPWPCSLGSLGMQTAASAESVGCQPPFLGYFDLCLSTQGLLPEPVSSCMDAVST